MCGLFLDLSFYSDSEFSTLYSDRTQDIHPVSSLAHADERCCFESVFCLCWFFQCFWNRNLKPDGDFCEIHDLETSL